MSGAAGLIVVASADLEPPRALRLSMTRTTDRVHEHIAKTVPRPDTRAILRHGNLRAIHEKAGDNVLPSILADEAPAFDEDHIVVGKLSF